MLPRLCSATARSWWIGESVDGDNPKDEVYGKKVERYNAACAEVDARAAAIETAKEDKETTEEKRDALYAEFTAAVELRDGLHKELRDRDEIERAKAQHKPLVLDG